MKSKNLRLGIAALFASAPLLMFGVSSSAMAVETAPHFCYDDALECGPSNWGNLADEWKVCATGQNQSPINISRTKESERLSEIRFNWKSTPLKIKNNGHTLQVNYEPGSSIRVNGETYQLLQFHFHSPSEHSVGGNQSPMEVHMVHVSDSGVLAVVGVMLDAGEASHTLEEIIANAPAEGGEVTIADKYVNASSFLPREREYWNYSGSLTTPPCSEGVRWHVLTHRTTVTHDQADEFVHMFHGGNARPVQPLNDRKVLRSDD